MLLAATPSDAIARIGGQLLHFAHAAPVGPSGGFFEDRQTSISVGRTDGRRRTGRRVRVAGADHGDQPPHRGAGRAARDVALRRLNERTGLGASSGKTPLRRVVMASMIGTTIEWYDFFLYGSAAALVFNKLFFPAFDPLDRHDAGVRHLCARLRRPAARRDRLRPLSATGSAASGC